MATLNQIKQRLEENQVVLSKSTVLNGLEKLKIMLKKCHYELDRVNSATTIASRQAYALDFSTHAPENKAKCIFIDESGFNPEMYTVRRVAGLFGTKNFRLGG